MWLMLVCGAMLWAIMGKVTKTEVWTDPRYSKVQVVLCSNNLRDCTPVTIDRIFTK